MLCIVGLCHAVPSSQVFARRLVIKASSCLGDTVCMAAGLGGLKVVGVAAGLAHTVACTDSGDVYSWGWNADGQLGLGDDSGRGEPELVSDAKLEHEHIDQVTYGGYECKSDARKAVASGSVSWHAAVCNSAATGLLYM